MKILFVCTGNICRSAMADAILKKRIKDLDKESVVQVYSCGTRAEDGNGATYNSIQAVSQYSVDLSEHKSTSLQRSDIINMDLILCMTNSHKIILNRIYPNLSERIYLLKEYVNSEGAHMDINDPWGYDLNVYNNCAEEINGCIDKLLEKIL